jgi:flagellar hook-associated protein 3 FlgL
MKTTFISTNAISAATRSSLMKVQLELAEAQKEMTTGRHADVGKSLGYRTSQTISLRQEHARLNTMIETNTVVSTRLEVTQSTLQNMVDNAQEFVGQLLASRNDGADAAIIKGQAESGLDTLTNSVNASYGESYLFAGVNTDIKPLADYFTTPASASSLGVENAFLTAFGITQSDPGVSAITATDMQTFLDTGFADLFDDPSWTTDWSSASNQNVRNRISTNELIETSANANESAIRKLAQAYTMVADLGVTDLNKETFDTVLNQAIAIASEAIQEMGEVQSRLGFAQQRVADASEQMSIQVDTLTTHVNSLEAVDPNEAATRVSSLLTQIESSYALTSRLMNLSILNYL